MTPRRPWIAFAAAVVLTTAAVAACRPETRVADKDGAHVHETAEARTGAAAVAIEEGAREAARNLERGVGRIGEEIRGETREAGAESERG